MVGVDWASECEGRSQTPIYYLAAASTESIDARRLMLGHIVVALPSISCYSDDTAEPVHITPSGGSDYQPLSPVPDSGNKCAKGSLGCSTCLTSHHSGCLHDRHRIWSDTGSHGTHTTDIPDRGRLWLAAGYIKVVVFFCLVFPRSSVFLLSFGSCSQGLLSVYQSAAIVTWGFVILCLSVVRRHPPPFFSFSPLLL